MGVVLGKVTIKQNTFIHYNWTYMACNYTLALMVWNLNYVTQNQTEIFLRKFLQQKADQKKRKFQESVNGFCQRHIIGLNKSMNEMTCEKTFYWGNSMIIMEPRWWNQPVSMRSRTKLHAFKIAYFYKIWMICNS